MKPRKRELSEARVELRAAAEFYERERCGLGFEFLGAIDTAIDAIVDPPGRVEAIF